MYACIHVSMYVCVYMYVCMYVCVYLYMCSSIIMFSVIPSKLTCMLCIYECSWFVVMVYAGT